MPHPAVLFSCFCSLCILYLKNIRTGRSILVNDISDGLQQRFVQRIAIFLLFFASHKNCRSHDTAPAGAALHSYRSRCTSVSHPRRGHLTSAGIPSPEPFMDIPSKHGRKTGHCGNALVIAVAVAVRLKHNRLSFYCFIQPADGTCVLGKDIFQIRCRIESAVLGQIEIFPNQEYTLVPK